MQKIIACTMMLWATAAQAAHVSWYGSEMHGRTASGARWQPNGLTLASRTLPFGTRVLLAYRGRSVVCTVTDRGPAAYTGRSLDLSRGCASALGMLRAGVANVSVQVMGR
jgi:rare lipoprotein A